MDVENQPLMQRDLHDSFSGSEGLGEQDSNLVQLSPEKSIVTKSTRKPLSKARLQQRVNRSNRQRSPDTDAMRSSINEEEFRSRIAALQHKNERLLRENQQLRNHIGINEVNGFKAKRASRSHNDGQSQQNERLQRNISYPSNTNRRQMKESEENSDVSIKSVDSEEIDESGMNQVERKNLQVIFQAVSHENRELKKARFTYKNAKKQFEMQREQKIKFENTLNDLNNLNMRQDQALESLQSEREALKQELEALVQEEEAYQNQAQAADPELSQLNSDVESLMEQLQASQALFIESNTKFQEAQTSKQRIENDIQRCNAKSKQYIDLISGGDNYEMKAKNTEKQIQEMEKYGHALNNQLQEKTQKFKEVMEQMRELREKVKLQIKRFQDIETQVMVIMKENVDLQTQLEQKSQQLINIYSDPGQQLSDHKQLLDTKRQRILLLEQENDILLKNLQQLQQKHQHSIKLFNDRRQNHSSSLERILQYEEQLKNMQVSYAGLKSEFDILDTRYKDEVSETQRLQARLNDSQSRLSQYENDIKVLNNQIRTLKRTNAEFEDKKSQELNLIQKENERVKSRDRENQNRLIYLERDLDQQTEQNRQLRKDLENSKNDCDQMIKMMENFEQKVEHYQKKEEYLTNLGQANKQKIEDAFLERDRARLREDQKEKTLRNYQQRYREEKENTRMQYDKMLQTIKYKSRSLIESKDEEMSAINEKLIQVQLQNERLENENNLLKQDLEKFTRALDSNRQQM